MHFLIKLQNSLSNNKIKTNLTTLNTLQDLQFSEKLLFIRLGTVYCCLGLVQQEVVTF